MSLTGRVGLLDKQMLAAEQQEKMSKLNNIEHRLGVEHDILTTSLGDLSAKIQVSRICLQVSSIADADVLVANSIVSRGNYQHAR